jgi:hypothetical protein
MHRSPDHCEKTITPRRSCQVTRKNSSDPSACGTRTRRRSFPTDAILPRLPRPATGALADRARLVREPAGRAATAQTEATHHDEPTATSEYVASAGAMIAAAFDQ